MLAANVVSAALVDELIHLRNVWQYWTSVKSKLKRIGRRTATTSLVAILATALLFVLEMTVVIITQQREFLSRKYDFNLRGVHPAGTGRGMALYLSRLALERECVVPVTQSENQRRNFHISVCFKEDNQIGQNVTGGDISIGSWYHSFGSEHEVQWAGNSLSLSVRAEVYSKIDESKARESWRLGFDNKDNERFDAAKYKHLRIIYGAIEKACNIEDDEEATLTRCAEMLEGLKQLDAVQTTKEVVWSWKKGRKREQVEGVISRFNVKDMGDDMYSALKRASRAEFVTSGAIMEVEGKGSYLAGKNGRKSDGLPGILTEDGRVAGVWLLLMLVCFGLITLLVLRWWLKPVRLMFLATNNILEFSLQTDENEVVEPTENCIEGCLDDMENGTHETFASPDDDSSGDSYTTFEDGNFGHIKI